MTVYERDYLGLLAYNDRLMIGADDECWPWRGCVQSKGYGCVGRDLVHRVVYTITHGPIPDGLTIDHLCRNRRCANPAHLEAVTMKENYERGEGWRGLALRWNRGDALDHDETPVEPPDELADAG